MRRSVWVAVFVTMLVLFVPGAFRFHVDLSRLDGALQAWERISVPAWSWLHRTASLAGEGREILGWIGIVLVTWVALTTLLSLLWTIWNHGTSGIRRAAARGQSVARIARHKGLAQDAVRFLLEPDATYPLTRPQGGKTFRPA